MDKIITAVISSLVVSGSLGYINYILLEKLGIITFDKNSKDDKKMVLFSFSALNYGLYLWIASHVEGAAHGDYRAIAIVIAIVGSVDILITPTLIAGLITLGRKAINLVRRKYLKKSASDAVLVRNDFFNTDKQQSIYIFNFDNKLITCGYLVYQGDANLDYFDLNLMPFDAPESEILYNDVIKIASKSDSYTLVDFEKQIKIYNIRS
ncbi:hypothetical protein [Latilactobacillus sakei]|uniref:hypothetical protein n=1 Tax=Latilactobacillus sakei TaxID=1599 RepID=UPI003F52B7AC